MRHLKQKITLGRESAARNALMRSLAEAIILHGSIKTTRAKARAIRTFVEPLVTKAKKNTLTERRALAKVLYTDKAINMLLNEIGPRYISRPGGYTRITKLAPRGNDGAEMVRIEFV